MKFRSEKAELHIVGPGGIEIFYAYMALTDEIRELDDKIIDCDYVNRRWIFKKIRNDRKHPNGRRAIAGTSNSQKVLPAYSTFVFGLEKMQALENPLTREILLKTLEKSKRT